MKEYQNIRNTLYLHIRKLRRDEHITQEQMAQMLGISRRTYANYERGVHAMPVDVLVNIADLFNISLDDLAGRKIEKSS